MFPNFNLKKKAPLSVLVSTYFKENPAYLELALNSIITQTLLPEELILVVDGPIGKDQENVIHKFQLTKLEFHLNIIRLAHNQGLASALNSGIDQCNFPYIARMDSDDICLPSRFEKQWFFLLNHPEIDILASWHSEFYENPNTPIFIKKTPPHHEAIVKKLKWRNVISHPTVIFRTNIIQKIGGYRASVGLLEDYDLYMRLIKYGAKFAAIQEPLVKIRVSKDQRVRRGGISYVIKEWKFRFGCFKNGNYSFLEFLIIAISYTFFRLVPSSFKAISYKLVRNRLT